MRKEITLKSTEGLHASLAVKLVQTATKYTVDFELHYKNKVVDLKSILGLMSLAIPSGENVKIIATGKQASEAIKDIELILGK
ncbi:HPr family phosphocarrier protein [bacterium]|nr:HPr family phosphocarrier protein [bacterium]